MVREKVKEMKRYSSNKLVKEYTKYVEGYMIRYFKDESNETDMLITRILKREIIRKINSRKCRRKANTALCDHLEQRYSFLLKLVRDYEKEYGKEMENADELTKSQYEKAKADLTLTWEKLKKCES